MNFNFLEKDKPTITTESKYLVNNGWSQQDIANVSTNIFLVQYLNYKFYKFYSSHNEYEQK